MTEFENLKASYTATIQFGLATNVGYLESKRGNEVLHEFCKQLVENSDYYDNDKRAMNQELELLKETLNKEIEAYYQHG